MALPAGVMLAVTLAESPAAMVGTVAGSKVTVQPCGGVAVRLTPSSGALPVLRTRRVIGDALPALTWALRRPSGVLTLSV